MDQREDQKPIGSGRDPDPVIGHGRISSPHRVDRNHPRAPGLQLADADLDGVRVMILGHSEHHEQLCPLPVRLAEFPEGPADGVDAPRRHVHRTKAPVCGIVRRAEVLRPPAGKALRLVASREEGQLLRCRLAQGLHPRNRRRQRLLPGDHLEGPGPARPHPAQRRAEAAGRGHLHDPRRPFGTEDALVDRMVPVALDVGDLSRLHVHVDAAAAGTHVAGGLADLVADLPLSLHPRLVHAPSPAFAACASPDMTACASRAIWRSSSAGTRRIMTREVGS